MESVVQNSEGQHQEIIEEISIHEKRILALLGDPSKYKNIDPDASKRVKFLDTNEYTEALRPEIEKASMKDGKVDEDSFNQKLHSIEGKRTSDGSIVVHTQKWEHGQWTPKTVKELEETADHEKTHGMLKPEMIRVEGRYPIRKTGCKWVMTDETETTLLKVEGHHTYESQTQILTLIGAHPEARSFSDIAGLNNQDYNSPLNLRAVCLMLDLAFPDFDGGAAFLADQYFRSDSDFVKHILESAEVFYSVKVPEELLKTIIADSNSREFSKHSVDLLFQVSNLKKVLIPPNPIEELNEATEAMVKNDELSEADLERVKKIADQLKKSLS